MAGFCREDILMEDNDILVVHKHAGMAVQNARMGQMDLEHALLNYLAKQTRAETPGQARTQIPISGGRSPARSAQVGGRAGVCEKQRRRRKTGTAGEGRDNEEEYLAVCEGKIENRACRSLRISL